MKNKCPICGRKIDKKNFLDKTFKKSNLFLKILFILLILIVISFIGFIIIISL